jgi:hypothetical protein
MLYIFLLLLLCILFLCRLFRQYQK